MRVSFQIMSLKSGGAEKILVFLANELAKRGHEIFILCIGDYYSTPFFKIEDSVKIIKIKRWNNRDGLKGKSKFFRNLYRIKRMKKELKSIKPDIAVSFLTNMIIPTAWAACILQIPHIACERNSPWDTPEHAKKRKRRDRAFGISKGCVVQTEEVKKYFPQKVQKKTVVQANPVLLSRVGKELPVPYEKRRKCVVSVGRLAFQKNHFMLVKAFAEFHKTHPEYVLDIYGQDYGEKPKLEELILVGGLTEAVHLLEPAENIHEIIADAAMFVLPSYYEGFPNALAEAAALGVPCIATECQSGGPSYILQGGKAGFLILQDDEKALTEAMRKIADDGKLTHEFSKNGMKLTAKLQPKKYIDFWEKYLTEMVKC